VKNMKTNANGRRKAVNPVRHRGYLEHGNGSGTDFSGNTRRIIKKNINNKNMGKDNFVK